MNDYFYETGSTQPPKSRLLVVFLLVLLIFVGGIITALGILNIQFWSAFSTEKEEPVSLRFTRDTGSNITQYAAAQPAETAPNEKLGFSAETVSGFLRAYYRLPQGVYIPQITDGSPAEAAGILPGDILLALNEARVTDTEMLNNMLRTYQAGDIVTLTLYRDGKTLRVELILH